MLEIPASLIMFILRCLRMFFLQLLCSSSSVWACVTRWFCLKGKSVLQWQHRERWPGRDCAVSAHPPSPKQRHSSKRAERSEEAGAGNAPHGQGKMARLRRASCDGEFCGCAVVCGVCWHGWAVGTIVSKGQVLISLKREVSCDSTNNRLTRENVHHVQLGCKPGLSPTLKHWPDSTARTWQTDTYGDHWRSRHYTKPERHGSEIGENKCLQKYLETNAEIQESRTRKTLWTPHKERNFTVLQSEYEGYWRNPWKWMGKEGSSVTQANRNRFLI